MSEFSWIIRHLAGVWRIERWCGEISHILPHWNWRPEYSYLGTCMPWLHIYIYSLLNNNGLFAKDECFYNKWINLVYNPFYMWKWNIYHSIYYSITVYIYIVYIYIYIYNIYHSISLKERLGLSIHSSSSYELWTYVNSLKPVSQLIWKYSSLHKHSLLFVLYIPNMLGKIEKKKIG